MSKPYLVNVGSALSLPFDSSMLEFDNYADALKAFEGIDIEEGFKELYDCTKREVVRKVWFVGKELHRI